MKENGTDNYFDLFHGGQHRMSEMGMAKPAAKALVEDGKLLGQHCFVPQEDGTVVFDINLSIPEEVRKRQIRNELREKIAELKAVLPEGPNKR